mmetsp:Transcript_11070/g.36408  ORF Transcript_11070/g.36408 Transcript_11070/m.36408 type:complete len:212 (+) Transcript_11070:262-897(+)
MGRAWTWGRRRTRRRLRRLWWRLGTECVFTRRLPSRRRTMCGRCSRRRLVGATKAGSRRRSRRRTKRRRRTRLWQRCEGSGASRPSSRRRRRRQRWLLRRRRRQRRRLQLRRLRLRSGSVARRRRSRRRFSTGLTISRRSCTSAASTSRGCSWRGRGSKVTAKAALRSKRRRLGRRSSTACDISLRSAISSTDFTSSPRIRAGSDSSQKSL